MASESHMQIDGDELGSETKKLYGGRKNSGDRFIQDKSLL